MGTKCKGSYFPHRPLSVFYSKSLLYTISVHWLPWVTDRDLKLDLSPVFSVHFIHVSTHYPLVTRHSGRFHTPRVVTSLYPFFRWSLRLCLSVHLFVPDSVPRKGLSKGLLVVARSLYLTCASKSLCVSVYNTRCRVARTTKISLLPVVKGTYTKILLHDSVFPVLVEKH